jgi:hypothetical protein
VEQGQHACSQQFWTCPAVHCALEGLEAIDLSLNLAIAPRKLDGVVYGADISAQNTGDAPSR